MLHFPRMIKARNEADKIDGNNRCALQLDGGDAYSDDSFVDVFAK